MSKVSTVTGLRDQRVDVAVIGGGAAGLAAARTATADGRNVAVIVDGPVGGDCTFTGCVPSKTLIDAAAAGEDFTAAMQRVRDNVVQIARTESADVLRAEGIDVIEGRASFQDTTHVEVGGLTVAADRVIIATGSTANIPSSLAGAGALSTDTLWAIEALPRSIAIIGGGPTGCELAQALARFGSRVTLLERSDRLLSGEEAEASALVLAALERNGVSVHLGVEITGSGQNRVFTSVADLEVSRVLAAAGRTPATDGLDPAAAGVQIDDRGYVITDDQLRTSCATILAAGDVTGKAPFTHAADAMGRIAAHNAFSRLGRAFRTDVIPRVTFTDPEVAAVGVGESEAAERGGQVAYLPLADVDRAIIAGRTDGYVKLIAGPRNATRNLGGGRLVGATIVAPHAGEMIGELALAMRTDLFTGRLAQTMHPYPTYSIAIQQAATQFFTTIGGRSARLAER